jgi:hypothetical protein
MSFHDVATRRNNALHSLPFHELPPLPLPAGDPPYRMWAADGRPPCGFRFLGCRRTRLSWFSPCPACASAWVLLVPDDDGAEPYRIAAELGCSGETCPPELIVWAHLVQVGELPIPEPDEQGRRRAAGIVRRILTDVPERPSERQLTSAAYQSGRWLEQSELPTELVADPLLSAAARAGFDPAIIASKLAAALTAGRARPGRLQS